MRSNTRTAGLLTVALLLLTGSGLAEETPLPGDAILGTWVTSGGASRVEVAREESGNADEVQYTGTIIWMKNPNFSKDDPEAGQPVRDRENPDPEKQDQPVVGLNILKSFSYAGDDVWDGGTIYDPENGKTYKCQITLVRPEDNEGAEEEEVKGDELRVRGYIGIPVIGRTTVWKRYLPAD